jgi:hypothetical protein
MRGSARRRARASSDRSCRRSVRARSSSSLHHRPAAARRVSPAPASCASC